MWPVADTLALLNGTPTQHFTYVQDMWITHNMEDRKCAECGSGEVEDVKHLLMRCEAWDTERKELVEKMKSLVAGLDEEEEKKRKRGDW